MTAAALTLLGSFALTLPAGREAKDLPLVVNPHGGPWARDEWGFNPEVQLLANRGYAVLQMNFRGSTGYGREFWAASFKQWGKTMQNDITDGVEWLTKSGKVDPARVASLGLSLEELRQVIVTTTVNGPKGTVQGRERTFTLLDNDQLTAASPWLDAIQIGRAHV